ncbi:hypothetical protein TRICI_005691 [Trichomonascus ciferrii]|uniref:AAA+ ATPase domain-containing protein n=1 Tax=Trichomonascus ciferrii TaxID=44093 RepID=A0A642UQA4_9ASCO|nr:hypothetical protein TRICI_005691 [Trichomonascus ciferrii]
MNLIRSTRRPSVQDSLQKTYDEAYQSSVHAILLETKGDSYSALSTWRETLDSIGESLSGLESTPPKSAGEKSLMASILDIERQCTDRIAFLELRQREQSRHASPYLNIPNDNQYYEQRPPLQGYRSSNGLAPPAQMEVDPNRSKSTTSLDPPKRHGFFPPAPQQQPHHILQQQQQREREREKERELEQQQGSSPQQQHRPMVKTLRTAKPGRISDGQKVGAASKAAVLAWDHKPAERSSSLTQTTPTSSLTSAQNGFEKLTMRGKHSGFNKVINESMAKPSGRKSPVVSTKQQNLLDDDPPFIDFDADFVTNSAKTAGRSPPKVHHHHAKQPSNPVPRATNSPKFSASTNAPLKAATNATAAKKPSKPAPPPPAPKPARLSPAPKQQQSAGRPPRSTPAGGRSQPASSSPSRPKTTDAVTRQQRNAGVSRASPKHARQASGTSENPIVVGEDPTKPDEAGKKEKEKEKDSSEMSEWDKKAKEVLKNLKGVDEAAAKQILNEIVIKGDEVHWDDIAGLEKAKSSLKETVVYPFLRPDLFSGLREPARGMLLFGPPGTGKTMLARAVATESHSTFFSISASSLTSKFLGESEKLVRALFYMARQFAPSIIFVDEIDSLLSSRSDTGEHEASRRIKNEFLVQWSDLQHAAAGREHDDESVQRVLVLAATNLPWAIDEAARRRFVRRQYIPLPERETRYYQLTRLLSHQKHALGPEDVERLLELTEGFSGSDITALAKDAAMGPLRSLGEALLTTPRDSIRPIQFQDFEASLKTIRPSVSKEGLKEFEEWAALYGSSGA